jgi:hypothetical protein
MLNVRQLKDAPIISWEQLVQISHVNCTMQEELLHVSGQLMPTLTLTLDPITHGHLSLQLHVLIYLQATLIQPILLLVQAFRELLIVQLMLFVTILMVT